MVGFSLWNTFSSFQYAPNDLVKRLLDQVNADDLYEQYYWADHRRHREGDDEEDDKMNRFF